MSILDSILFVETIESTNNNSSQNNNKGCGCFIFIAATIFLFLSIEKCENPQEELNKNTEVQIPILSYNKSYREDFTSSDLSANNDSDSIYISYIHKTIPPHFNAHTVEEARKEGQEYGYDDGEEDGMNNDEDDSYDDSCPYHGKMKKAYVDAYHEGYEEGWEDGQDSFLTSEEDNL